MRKEVQGVSSHFHSSLTGGCKQVEVDLFANTKRQGERKLLGEV